MKPTTPLANKPENARNLSRAGQRGQALLEFALMLPFLTLVGVGIIEVGRTIYYTVAINNAAAAGVAFGSRDAITASDNTGIQTAAMCDANGGSGSACRTGILTRANTNVAHGCLCDNGGGSRGESCAYPISLADCGALSCDGGQLVECVQVNTTATFAPLFHYPGLPASYSAYGKAVMRVRK